MINQTTSRLDGTVTARWETLFAHRTEWMKSSAIRELLKVTQLPGIISLAGGLPAPELFPIREFQAACNYVLETCGQHALQYGATEGFDPLKQHVVDKMRVRGVPAECSNILITNGSQQGLDFMGRLFIDEGDCVLTESPTYLGALQAFNAYQPRYVTVPLDDDGMQVDRLDAILSANHVKFIYVLPNFQNPGGSTLSLKRRHQLVKIAAHHRVFMVEDDPYGDLRFEGEDLPPLISLHKENVLYLGTFSKILAPGIRLGWVVAPEAVLAKIVQAKQGSDLHTSTFIQMVAHHVLESGMLDAHIDRIRAVYRERRDVMNSALRKYFPPGCHWTVPQGGLFLWVRLPEQIDTSVLLPLAVQNERVAFVPGLPFFAADGKPNTMRLNFSNASPEMIEEAIRRLGRAIERQLGS